MNQLKKITKSSLGVAALSDPHHNGITLISLVITVVVLLILAGVAISIVVSPDGLFTKSEQAKTDWNAKVDEEQIKINEALGYLETERPVQSPAGWDSSKVAAVVEEGTRKAPIPVGYTASKISTEDEIREGLVIYQTKTAVTGEPNSEAHITAMEGINQYVWIPVDDINDMVMCKKNGKEGQNGKKTCELDYNITKPNEITCRVHGYDTSITLSDDEDSPDFIDTTGLAGRLYGTKVTGSSGGIYQTSMTFTDASKDEHKFVANSDSSDSGYREPDIVKNADNFNYQLVLNEASEALESVNELKHQLNNKFIEMAKSIAKYGGFYVSRYEAGANGASLKNQKVLVAGAKTLTGHNPNTYTNGNEWYGIYNTLMSSTAADKTAVNTHMIWGCQYDQIIKFLSENSVNEPQIGHTTRQLNAQKLTGETSTDIMSNIFDLEGNNEEWTVQASSLATRVSRGGCFDDVTHGFFCSPSYRSGGFPDDAFCSYTSRSVLYIE